MKLYERLPVPLHPSQERIYYAQAADFSDPRFIVGGYLEMTGCLDVERLQAAVAECWQQSDALRTVIQVRDGEPVQRLGGLTGAPALGIADLRGEADPLASARQSMQAKMDTPFDVAGGAPLASFEIIRVGDQSWYFFSKYHLLVADAAACGIVVNNIVSAYLRAGSDAVADEQPQYQEAVAAAQAYQQSPAYAEDQRHWDAWLERHAGAQCALFAAGEEPGDASGQLQRVVPDGLFEKLQRIGQETGASIIQLSMAALSVCFAAMAGRNEWLAGVPLHNRTNRRLRRLVGPLVNTIPSVVQFDPALSVRDWLSALKLGMLTDMRHRGYPLHHLLRSLQMDEHSRSLFDVILNYNRMTADVADGELRITATQLISSHEKVALHLRWNDYGPEQPLRVSASHNLALLGGEAAGQLLDRFFAVLARMEDQLDQPMESLLPSANA